MLTNENKIKLTEFWIDGENYDSKEEYYAYLAPEIKKSIALPLQDEYDYDKADVYSVGLVFFELISLKNISQFSKSEDHTSLIEEIDRLEDVSSNMKDFFINALKKKPRERYNFKQCIKSFGSAL